MHSFEAGNSANEMEWVPEAGPPPPPTVDTREPGAPPGAGTRALTRDCRALTSMKEALM